MKKLFITFLILSLSIFQVYSYTLSTKDKQLVNKVAKIIDKKTQKKGIEYKNNILKLLKTAKTKSKNNERKHEIISEIISAVEDIKIITQADIDKATLEKYHANPSQLREHWLELYNNYRSSQGISKLTYDKRLENTGQQWSDTMLFRGKISHEQTPGDGYYNYPIIEQWFQNRGVTCKVSGRTTSVENTGYHAYYCPNGGDCTEKAKTALGEIFQYYLDEKGLPYPQNAHYKTTISPYLQYMGLGLSFKDEGNGWIQVYTAAHFCTEFE